MSYSIEIKGRSRVVVGSVSEWLPKLLPQKRIVVVSDANIESHYHALLAHYDCVLIGQSEVNKTLATVDTIYKRFIELGIDRSCFVLGVGGGIVTDVAGFAAATYMRGVEFGFVSTTLLGEVDASVGGKNGVNVEGYKNMVGTFCQPRFVICDVDMLSTLPEREFRAGMAEVVKSAIIADAQLFERLEGCDFSVLQHDAEQLKQIVYRAIKVKADIVERDEREQGDRRKLNLGHTLAHAIEKSSSKMNHGEAVAVGLAMICDMAVACGRLSASDNARIKSLLLKVGFELEPPVGVQALKAALEKDKKSEGDSIHIVWPTAIGDCVVEKMTLEGFKALF